MVKLDMQNELKIFSGNANVKLAENVGKILGIEMGKAYVGRTVIDRTNNIIK